MIDILYTRRQTWVWPFMKMKVGERILIDPRDAKSAAKSLAARRDRSFGTSFTWVVDPESGALSVTRQL